MTTPKQPEHLPKQIQEKIELLRNLETKLGHLPPSEWSVKDLSTRLNNPQHGFQSSQLEQQTELIFGDICDELSDLGMSSEQIADVINRHLSYEGGPSYCNAREVGESLGNSESRS